MRERHDHLDDAIGKPFFFPEHKSCEMEADLDLTRQRLETKIREVESRDAEIREINEKFTATKSKVLLLEETSSRWVKI